MRTLVFTLALSSLVSAGAFGAEIKWHEISSKAFSFRLPATFTKAQVEPIDSFVEKYVADGIEIDFDYGIYSDNFMSWPEDTKFEDVTVDGRKARIGVAKAKHYEGFTSITMIHIPLDGRLALSMCAVCRSDRDVALARKIFRTIAFKKDVVPNKSPDRMPGSNAPGEGAGQRAWHRSP
jgi:hypothetical protein